MNFTIGTLLAFSFVASMSAMLALIWAISSKQLHVTQEDAKVIFEEGEEPSFDDSTSSRSSSSALEAPALERRYRFLLLFMFVSAAFWLVFGSFFGLIASLKLHLPEFLVSQDVLTFGRMRTMHLNSVIYGFLSLSGVGVAYWVVPAMFKTTARLVKLALIGAMLWNVSLFLGVGAIAHGWTDGLEWLEIPWQIDIGLAIAGALLAIPLVVTARHRHVHHIYVSGWYYLAGLMWFPVLFLLANVPGIHHGAQQATTNWWFAHNVLGLWLTPLGLGAAYYFLPKIIGKPIYSYRLSLIGFWALALFYSQVGMHHLIGGPVPTWVVSLSVVQSVMMIVPVIAVAINQHTLSLGNPWAIKESLPFRFIAVGAIMYTLASVQGSMEAIRAINTITHFTHYTVGHAHMGAYAFVAWVLFGAMYYILPRVVGQEWPSRGGIALHFWLVFIGFVIYFVALTIGGWLQGLAMLDPARSFLESMELTKPYLTARSIGGGLMTFGHLVFVYNFIQLWRRSRSYLNSPSVANATTVGRAES